MREESFLWEKQTVEQSDEEYARQFLSHALRRWWVRQRGKKVRAIAITAERRNETKGLQSHVWTRLRHRSTRRLVQVN